MKKKILIGIGIFFILIVAFFFGYLIKMKSELKKMTPAATSQIAEDLYAIQDSFTNIYFIKDSSTYILIDAGNDKDAINAGLKKLNISADDVVATLLTHTDQDHVAALELFPNAEVYLSVEEEQMINGKTSRFMSFKNKINAKNYTLIQDQDIVEIGNKTVQGILTKGHTPGSMCYVINNKYLFTGDLLSLKEGKIEGFNKLFNMDTEQSEQSINKIVSLPEIQYILTAHYGFTKDYKNAVKDWCK